MKVIVKTMNEFLDLKKNFNCGILLLLLLHSLDFLEILNFSKRFPWSVDSNFYLKYKFRILESQIILKIQLTSEILACHRIRCAFVRALGVDGRTRCTPYCSVWLTNDVRFRISIRLFSANFDEYSRGNFRNS